jgi:DNA-binding protein H-NS
MVRRKSNFAKMNLDQLVEMGKAIGRELENKITEERRWLESRLAALGSYLPRSGARKSGAQKRGSKANGRRRAHPLKGRKAPIKYRGPQGETWSGRGLAPRWLTALEKKGKRRETFLVKG